MTPNFGKYVKQPEQLYIVSGSVKSYNHCGELLDSFF